MEAKPGVTVYWGILLAVYIAILFASSMVALTSDTSNGYFVAILAVGVPIYLIASRTIMREQDEPVADARAAGLESKLIPFPERPAADVAADVARAAADARAPHLRKLG